MYELFNSNNNGKNVAVSLVFIIIIIIISFILGYCLKKVQEVYNVQH